MNNVYRLLVQISIVSLLWIVHLPAYGIYCSNCSNIVTQYRQLFDSYRQTQNQANQYSTQLQSFAKQLKQLAIMQADIKDADIQSIRQGYQALVEVTQIYNNLLDHNRRAQQIEQLIAMDKQQVIDPGGKDSQYSDISDIYDRQRQSLQRSLQALRDQLKQFHVQIESERHFINSLVDHATTAEGQKEIAQILTVIAREQLKQVQRNNDLLLQSIEQQARYAVYERKISDSEEAIDDHLNKPHLTEAYTPKGYSKNIDIRGLAQ